MIVSFNDIEIEKIWLGSGSRRFPSAIQDVARRKLRMLDSAQRLDDLRIPPDNRLEALKNDRKGQHSIQVNSQWRICCCWMDGNASRGEVVDYH